MSPIAEDRLAVGSCGRIDVYPVGWCAALIATARMARHRPPWRVVTANLRQELGYTVRKARKGEWRAVKSSLNGWLAEPEDWPMGLTRCGSGWTRRRALRDLNRRFRKACAPPLA